MAYADYNDLIDLTEKLLSGMVKSIFGKYQVGARVFSKISDLILSEVEKRLKLIQNISFFLPIYVVKCKILQVP